MSTSLPSPVTAIPVSSSISHLRWKNCSKPCYLNCDSHFRIDPLFSYRTSGYRLQSLPRKSFKVQATVLQDKEDDLVVEKSFTGKTLPDDELMGESSKSSLPNGFESWIIKLEQSLNILLTDSVIKILDSLYHDRNYARFFVLETIARVPYFSFISVLHMYESFGWWRKSDYLKVHFAESWNEMHHLLIMEELGGNSWWFDRFLAQHIAVFYYFMTVFMYALSPRMAYHFSECVEHHAYETYDKFIKEQGDELKKLPAPEVAVKYYTGGDLYLFDEFQTSKMPNSRRPKIDNLYDVFVNIREDEGEHCKTMKACQTHGNLRSPHSYQVDADVEDEKEDTGCTLPQTDCEGIVDCIKKSFGTSEEGFILRDAFLPSRANCILSQLQDRNKGLTINQILRNVVDKIAAGDLAEIANPMTS